MIVFITRIFSVAGEEFIAAEMGVEGVLLCMEMF